MDELARDLGIAPVTFRRRNVVQPGDPLVSIDEVPHDVEYGSYGLDQCLDQVEAGLAHAPPGGFGTALPLWSRAAPRIVRHHSPARPSARPPGVHPASLVLR